MTKIEYIKSLVATGLTSKEISAKTREWDAENAPAEEVKTEVVADQTDAAVTTTTNEASTTASESSDGSSQSAEEKEIADAEAAAKAKLEQDRIDSLYNKYHGSEEYDQVMVAKKEKTATTTEEKAKWLKNNIAGKIGGSLDGIDGRDSPTLGLIDALTLDVFDFDGVNNFDNQEVALQLEINKDQELKDFNYNQANLDYVKNTNEIIADTTLSPEEKEAKLKELKPADLIIESDVEIEIEDIDVEFDSLANTLAGKDATLEMFDGNQQKLDDYNTYNNTNDLLTDITDSSLNANRIGIKSKHPENPDYDPNRKEKFTIGDANYLEDKNPKYLTPLDLYIKEYGIPTYEDAGLDASLDTKEGAPGKNSLFPPQLSMRQRAEMSLRRKKAEFVKSYSAEQDAKADTIEEGSEGLEAFSGGYFGSPTRIKILKEKEVNPTAVRLMKKNFPEDASSITNDADLKEALDIGYNKLVNNDVIINAEFNKIQEAAKPLIKSYQDEIMKTADLTTPEGVAAANKKLEDYARSITVEKLQESESYKQRVMDLGLVANAAMKDANDDWGRQQDGFLSALDSARNGSVTDNFVDFFESMSKGGINMYNSFQKAGLSLEGKGVRDSKRAIARIDQKVEDGEITKEEGEKLKNKKGAFNTNSLVEELSSDKEDVADLLDSINSIEEYTGLFKAADLEDGDISFSDIVMTVGEAVPQIAVGAASVAGSLMSGGTLAAPILAGLGTAAMFTQMYGDTYWDAYQEGIQVDIKNLGIDWDSMSVEEQRAFNIKALEEGKHADIATSAGFAGVMTAAERFGMGKVLGATQKALGLGGGGMASLFKGQFKQFGKQMLAGALARGEAGITEFGTEYMQEVLGQVSKGIQANNKPLKHLDFDSALTAGKAGGIVGMAIPFAGAVASQSVIEVRNMARDVAIKFAPNSKYGKFSKETEKFFQEAQKNIDSKLSTNVLTEKEYQEESAQLASVRNSNMKIDPNADVVTRSRQLDLMIERDKLQRYIKSVDDSDLTQEEQGNLETVREQLKEVVGEQKLYSNSANVRKAIVASAKKSGKDLTFQDFKSQKEMDRVGKELKSLGYETKSSIARQVKEINDNPNLSKKQKENRIAKLEETADQHGVTLYDPKTKKEVILINNEISTGEVAADGTRSTANTNVAAHEFLHTILRQSILNNPEIASVLSTELETYLESINTENIDPNSEYGKNVALYKEGKIQAEEKLTLFADALANGDVVLDEGMLTKLNDFFRRLFQKLGVKQVNFNDGKDVLNFIKDYNKTIAEGKNLNKAQQKVLEEGAQGDLINRPGKPGVKKPKSKKPNKKESKKRKQESVLESIDKLVPQDITTKKEYDDFLSNQRQSKPLFDALLLDGGVINNYVKSRTTTRAEANKAIESLTDRILNFNPEAKRADGKAVGMKGFGEAIFANTRFAKLDAKKALFQEGEKAKQQKSIDEGTMQIADDSSTSKQVVDKVAKKPSETTGFDKATETRIDEAIDQNFEGSDVRFSETKNVPSEVADIYGEMFGINPQTITDKTRNYSKKDAEGLTKAKQFLLKNAKNDYARLPQLKDDFGKGTFVPKNVKDALYTDGKLTGSLKDYIDLIRKKPIKPIYRDSVGQTIRGLLNLAIRNRILETAQPSQAKRLQSGAKFSRKRKVTPQIEKDLRKMSQLLNKGQVTKALDFVSNPINEGSRVKLQEAMLKAVKKYGLDVATIEAGMMSSGGKQTFYGKSKNGTKYNSKKEAKEAGITTPKKYVKRTNGDFVNTKSPDSKKGTDWVAKPGRLYYSVKDPAYVKLMESAKDYKGSRKSPAQRINTPGKKGKKTKFTKKQMQDNEAQNEINMDTLDHVVNQLADAVEAGMPMEIAGAIIIQSYQATTGLVKIAAPFKYVSNTMEYSTDGKASDRIGEKFREEHNPPASVVGASILYAIKSNAAIPVMAAIKSNYYQTQLSKKDDSKIDIAKLAGVLPQGKSILDNPVTRLTDAGISLSSITNPLTGQTLAQENNVEVPSNLESDPNVIAIQNSLVSEQQRIENPITAKQAQDRMNVFTESLAKPIIQASKKRVKSFSPKLNNAQTVDQQIEVLGNYDKASAKARSLNTPEKGISVFDFDDTLAKTKEKVIVNKLDGTTESISASEFAKSAVELEGNGATFDFSEFENVGKGTQKGPLADLALKRQEKFGSKDIFVLTARPQVAAQGIKVFLDGIGLSLPLKNITGLENGSPQAKADWVIEKAADGYNDFYFADDAMKNVKAVKEVLNQIDVKSDVQQAKFSKKRTFDKITNEIIETATNIKSYKEYSPARAKTIGAKKGRFTFFTTPSAEDFKGLLYKLLGKGKVGDAQFQFFQDNLINPYNRAEQAVTRAKISAANDFKTLKNSLKTLPKSLSKKTGIGGFTFSQAARVAAWTRQGMEVPGLSKKDAKELNDFVDNNPELNSFVDELIKIQKGKPYPAPGQNWLGGNITSDIINEINKVNRADYMQEFNENVDLIFTDKVMNKLEAAYGPRYVEALRDQLRRMKAGSNRPVGNSRIVDQVLNWLNNSVGAIMFLNTRSAVLQTISAVNFINFGNNNLIAAGRALLNQKQYWKDFMTLMNSPYLTERRDGLKINVSESEIADAVSESSNKPKAFLNLLLSKGFVLTRIADSFAIAAGGATFYRNQVKAYVKSGMDQKAAEKQAFDDFYAIAEESQQSSNPSKISQQQASGAGRVILAFANTPMQYARIMKRAGQDLINGRGDWKTNVSKIVYYGAIQNLIFNALSNALFASLFDEEGEEEEDKTGRIANGMADSLLRGLGIQGAAVAAIKDALITIYEEANKEKGAPEFRKAIQDLFGFSPPLDAKIRKLNSGLNTLSWEREKMEQEGYSINNPAYLAYAQIIAGLTNLPMDRAIQKINNLRAAASNSSDTWQKVALLMGWSAWDLGLPYYGVEDKEVQTPQTILRDKVLKMKKETSGKEQKQMLLDLGLTKQEIVKLKYEEIRIKKIIELQNKK